MSGMLPRRMQARLPREIAAGGASDAPAAPVRGGLQVQAAILVVEDEPDIQELIRLHLQLAGHKVTRAATAEDANAELRRAIPDLILLDWMLPGISGLDWARQLRSAPETRQVPIIMLSARAAEQDKVEGLDAGVDDYVTKPFSPRELLSRIAAVLRRRAPQLADAAVEIDGLSLNHATREITADGVPLHLGPTEFRLLQYFMTHPERMHTRGQLVIAVWGGNVEVEDRTVDVNIGRLRDTLKSTRHDELIETVRGGGYRLRTRRTGRR